MKEQAPWRPTRRSLLIASCGFLLPRIGWSARLPAPVLAWPLHRTDNLSAESSSGSQLTTIAATGRLEWVQVGPGVRAPRLDGYSVWFEDEIKNPIVLQQEVTLSAWLALESFPVQEASVIEWSDGAGQVRLSVDRLGFVQFAAKAMGVEVKIRTEHRLDRGRWTHLASTLSKSGQLVIYIDGVEQARASAPVSTLDLPKIQSVFLARAQQCEVVAKVFPTGVLNGVMHEARIYDVCLTAAQIGESAREYKSAPADLVTNPSWFEADDQRPLYHAMPPRAWTNEPHGLVFWQGQYHLFYQKNPSGPYWGHIHWGHLTSPDLLRWTEQPIALTPEPGPDSEGCWSGSVIVVNDKLHIFYTGGDGKRAAACIATSEDGMVFEKYKANPIIAGPPDIRGVKEFRDPFIWKEGAEFRMIIGSGIEGAGGTALLYRSADLISWQYVRPLLIGDKQSSGVFWEMPVFVKLGNYHVLIVCEVPGRASYWVGTWKNDEFHVISSTPQRLDLLNHLLSPTPLSDRDGRVITMGIVPDTRDSREAWQAGWAHLYGVPRELSLTNDLRLQQKPIAELGSRFTRLVSEPVPFSIGSDWQLCRASGSSLRVCAQFVQDDADAVTISFRRDPGQREETTLSFDWRAQQFSLNRTLSSLNPHVLRNLEQALYSPANPGKLDLDILLDQSVVEVFVDKFSCFSFRIYPVLPESLGIALRTEGGKASVTRLDVYTLIR